MQSLETSSASLTTEGEKLIMDERAPWHSVAPELMQKIFSSLSDQDRCRAMLVCGRWRQILQAPGLWRSREFTLTDNGDETQRAKQYLQVKGRPLRRLTVDCQEMVKGKASDLETILKACGSNVARLENLELYGRFEPVPRFVKALCHLVRVQTGLTDVSLVSCGLTLKGGCSVLRALSSVWMTGTRKDLILDIRDLFFGQKRSEALALHSDFIQELGRFRAIVKNLHLSYHYLSRPLLEVLTSDPGGGLENKLGTLYLYYDRVSSDQAPSNQDWEAAVKRCPRLRVDLSSDFDSRVLSDVLRPQMPVCDVTIDDRAYDEEDCEIQNKPSVLIPRLLDYIADNFSSTLTDFHLDFGQPWTPLQNSEALVQLVSRCPLLKSVKLNMAVSQEAALRVLEAAAGKKLESGPKKLTMNVLRQTPRLVKRVEAQNVQIATLWEPTTAKFLFAH